MSNETPQKQPQIDRKSTANYNAGRDLKVINNYYEEGPTVDFSYVDLIGFAILVGAILFLFGFAIWGLYQIGLMIVAAWGWVWENRFIIGIGFVACILFATVTFWYYVTYTQEENDPML